MVRRFIFLSLFVLVFALPLAAVAKGVFPDVIPLADGFQPEGIVGGYGHTFYYGALNGGAIFRGDFRTGEIESEPLVPPQDGLMAVGMSFDRRSNLLYVAGGFGGSVHVYDGTTGDGVDTISLTTPFAGFINDAIVTREAVYLTDSFQAQIYRIPLGAGGSLPDPASVGVIPLSGDFVLLPQPGLPDFVINANGIEATPDGGWLLIVHSALGVLYRVDPASGEATFVDGVDVPNGDGLVLNGHNLYVVQNFNNQIGVVRLDPGFASGNYIEALTNDAFRIPTTAAKFGNALYAVNARFDEVNPLFPVPPDEDFEAVRVELN